MGCGRGFYWQFDTFFMSLKLASVGICCSCCESNLDQLLSAEMANFLLEIKAKPGVQRRFCWATNWSAFHMTEMNETASKSHNKRFNRIYLAACWNTLVINETEEQCKPDFLNGSSLAMTHLVTPSKKKIYTTSVDKHCHIRNDLCFFFFFLRIRTERLRCKKAKNRPRLCMKKIKGIKHQIIGYSCLNCSFLEWWASEVINATFMGN